MGANIAPKTINEILDRLDVIREELLIVQRSIEKLATIESVMPVLKDRVRMGVMPLIKRKYA